jgi:hypothetical protein
MTGYGIGGASSEGSCVRVCMCVFMCVHVFVLCVYSGVWRCCSDDRIWDRWRPLRASVWAYAYMYVCMYITLLDSSVEFLHVCACFVNVVCM